MIWSKAFIQLRHRYDGADIAHLILKQHAQIDWRRLLGYVDLHWEVLLVHLLNFRWAYPSERDCVPRWLMGTLFVIAFVTFLLMARAANSGGQIRHMEIRPASVLDEWKAKPDEVPH